MNKFFVFIVLLFSPVFTYGQEPQVVLRNCGEIISIFNVKGVSLSGQPIQVPIVNGLVPEMGEGTYPNGVRYYVFDYRARKQYSEYQGFILNYDPNFKAQKTEPTRTYPLKDNDSLIKPKEDNVTKPKDDVVIKPKDELKLKRPSEIGGSAKITPQYQKD